MPNSCSLSPLSIDRIRDACVEKAFANAEAFGIDTGSRQVRPHCADWQSKLFRHAADRSATTLAFQANPLIVDLALGTVVIRFPIDFSVATRRGVHLVAFDMPALYAHEHDTLLSLAARQCRHRLVHISDVDLDTHGEVGRMSDLAAGPLAMSTRSLDDPPPPRR